VRYSYGTTPTDYRFTDQQEIATIGLYNYGARFYDPSLGRFVSPDTIIPLHQGSQAWDRYAYVNNNPIRYKDPTGQGVDCGIADSGCYQQLIIESYIAATVRIEYGDPDLPPPNGAQCLGTAIDDHSLLTHNHFEDQPSGDPLWETPQRIFNGSTNSKEGIAAMYSGESMVVATQAPLNAQTAKLADQQIVNSIGRGYTLTLVYMDDITEELKTGDFTVLRVHNGIATLSDPNSMITKGDSGGGAFYNGFLVGNTYGIRPGEVDIELLPGFVISRDWQWMERNEWWRNDPQ
jgi:RHS repeat-associated protein